MLDGRANSLDSSTECDTRTLSEVPKYRALLPPTIPTPALSSHSLASNGSRIFEQPLSDYEPSGQVGVTTCQQHAPRHGSARQTLGRIDRQWVPRNHGFASTTRMKRRSKAITSFGSRPARPPISPASSPSSTFASAWTASHSIRPKDVDGGSDATGLGAWKSLEEREGTQVILNVWNSKRQQLRQVSLVPSRQWSSQPSSSTINGTSSEATSQPSLLGLSLRLCNPSQALSHVWHILEILEGSPAESAGLVPFGDFVIGWPGGVLSSEGDFYELVEAHTDRALRLYVYNSDYDHTREVIIVPNREWGGEGLLGCGVGYGLLHRIPKPQDLPKVPPELSAHENEDQEIPEDQLKTPRIGGPPSAFATPAGNSRFEEDDFSTPMANPSNASTRPAISAAAQGRQLYSNSHDKRRTRTTTKQTSPVSLSACVTMTRMKRMTLAT